VKDYGKLSREKQLEILLKQSTITGTPPTKNQYKQLGSKWFDNIFKFLNQTPPRALNDIVNNFGLTSNDLKNLWSGQQKGNKIDFYPTPKKCVNELFEQVLPEGHLNNKLNVLEGTAGLGSVAYWVHKQYPNLNMNANELNPNLYKLMDKFLPDQIKRTNKDFLNINTSDYDIIFLNPPFGENNNFLWVKFLLHGLHLLNISKHKNKWLLLVSPPLV